MRARMPHRAVTADVCSQCGSEAYLALIEPIREAGMQDYRLDAIKRPERHPAAVDRLCSRRRAPRIDHARRRAARPEG
jgi:hypothetical protein